MWADVSSNSTEVKKPSLQRWGGGWVASWIAVAALVYLIHFAALIRNAVDVPWGDEWELFNPRAAIKPFGLEWLFSFHNEHRIVFSRLLTAIFHGLGELNYRSMAFASFVIYGVLVATVFRLSKKMEIPSKHFAPFLIFFFSAAAADNFIWPFQSCFHFVFLFFTLALLVFDPRNFLRTALMIVFLAAAVFSLAIGPTLALGIGIAALALPSLAPFSDRRRYWVAVIAIEASIALTLLVWSRGYVRSPEAFAFTWPYRWLFWQHYLGTLSWLGGMNRLNDGITAITTLLGVFVLYQIIRGWKRPAQRTASMWILTTYCGALLLSLGVVSLGRATLGGGQGKTSRYAEIVMMLLPLVVWALGRIQDPRRRKALLVSVWTFCLLGHAKNFLFFAKYAPIATERRADLDCALHSPSGDCPTLYPNGPIGDRMPLARELGATFTRKAI